ncbi:MAG TPA: precorrin-6y C5,15-methyltransferase (decarboxylating) subunit CbiE [Solirubrobacteraceae bacterium]
MIAVLGVHGGRVPAGTEQLLAQAQLVAGGSEVLDALAPAGARRLTLGADLEPALRELAGAGEDACVLASGDPGFFGIVRTLSERVGADRLDVHPAPSSVAIAFGRLGIPWDDAVVVSAHGRDPRAALAAALRHPKVAILTSPANDPAWFAARLIGRRLVVAQRLGHPDEQIRSATAEELTGQAFADPNVLLVFGDEDANGERAHAWPPRTPSRWALADDQFSHRAGMVTKAEVRALALARLGPGLGDLIWDVGCGSGSVAIECARLGAAVVAIDSDADAIERTTANARAHHVPIRTVAGTAPDALAELPDPDAVFVGGGGDRLEPILDICAARAGRAVVVTLALVERVGPVISQLASHGLEAEATMLQASRLRPLAGGHRLAAENPVFVVAAERR